MRIWNSLILFGLAIIMFSACQVIFEEDIADEEVLLLAPANGLITTDYTLTFWWQEVDDATKYNLQVVRGSFDYITKFVLDTNISSNQFAYTFSPDTFEWRVKAYNDAHETSYYYASFRIDSTEKPQTVNLISPSNNTITNADSITFKWGTASNATRYRILVTQDDETFSESEIDDGVTVTFPDDELGLSQLTDGEYYWQVRSENTKSNSEYSSAWLITVDLTAPGTPKITVPSSSGDTVDEFKISWKHPVTGGTAIYDSLIVYKDSSGTTKYYEQYAVDTTYSKTGANNGWYHFKVKSVDAATNQSEWTNLHWFYYQSSDKKK